MSTILNEDTLDEALEQELLGNMMAQGQRALGIEVEFLILHRETRQNAPLEFCRGFLDQLATDLRGARTYDGEVLNRVDGDRIYLTMEPGGQLEVATVPVSRMADIEPITEPLLIRIGELLEPTGYELVSLGHAPKTPVAELGLLPRERYRIMDKEMPKRGALTRNMMRATAGIQITYDVQDREDAGRKLALLYRLSPLLAAITANSREVEGKDSGYASFRQKVWCETDTDRTGVPAGCLHAETAIDAYKRFALKATTLFLKRDGQLVEAPARPFGELVREGVVDASDLSLHLSSLFPQIRLRNYLEVRCLDAVPWNEARSVLALLSGIVYCNYATRKAEQLSEALVIEDPAALHAFHAEVARTALDTNSPGGPTLRELATELLGFLRATLGGPDCDWASVDDLDCAERRLQPS